MQTIQALLISLGSLYLWFMLPTTLRGKFGMWFNKLTNFKPLNCKLCLSLWVSVGLVIWFKDPIYISLPLIYSKL